MKKPKKNWYLILVPWRVFVIDSTMPSLRLAPALSFGAIVKGIHLNNLSDVEWHHIYGLFLEHGLLVFPDQLNLTKEEQMEFANRFGRLELPSIPISNQRKDGSLLQCEETVFKVLRGNEGWHTDSTYMPISSKCAVLYAPSNALPSAGGETAFADARASYDALDSKRKAYIANLSAFHST